MSEMTVTVLKTEIEKLKPILNVSETEDSWESISKGLSTFRTLCQNGASDWPEELIPAVRLLSRPIVNSMTSERTRLSGVAIDLVSSVALGLGTRFEPILHIFLPVLLTLCGRTNKVIISRSRSCISTIIEMTQLPAILSYLLQSIQDKSTSLRLTAAEGVLACLNCFNPPDLERDIRAREIEGIIRTTARDAHADVRKVSRKIFEAYKLLLPGRVESFTEPLSPTMKKYLEIKPSTVRSQPISTSARPTTSESKQDLSASTSALFSSRAPITTARLYARSVSSSTVRSDGLADLRSDGPSKPIRTAPPKATMSAMPPPQYVPMRPAQPSGHIQPASRTISVSNVLKRTTSATTLPGPGPAIPGKSGTTPGHSSRPASANSLPDTTGYLKRGPAPHSNSQELAISGPRRVPLPQAPKESTKKAPSKQASNNTTSPPLASLKANQSSLGADDAISSARPSPVQVPNNLIANTTKRRGVAQPTLSQLSRAKAVSERKTATTADAKPIWGRATVKKVASKHHTNILDSSLPVVKPSPGSASPAEVPLPPSPSPPPSKGLDSLPAGTDIAETKIPSIQVEQEAPISTSMTMGPVTRENYSEERLFSGHAEITAIPKDTAQDTAAQAEDMITGDSEKTKTPVSSMPMDLFDTSLPKTPISSLLSSIERGFLFTPSSPLSPPQSQLSEGLGALTIRDLVILSSGKVDETHSSDKDGGKQFMFGLDVGKTSRNAFDSVENSNTRN